MYDLQKTLVAKQEAQPALFFLQNETDTLLVTAHRVPNPDNLGSLQDKESPEHSCKYLVLPACDTESDGRTVCGTPHQSQSTHSLKPR